MSGGFRENLRRELDFRGVIVKELSARTGIPIPTLDCYLGTRATMPSADAAVKIAQALCVSVEYLVTGRNCGQPEPMAPLCPEAREIIRRAETLQPEQARAILSVLRILK